MLVVYSRPNDSDNNRRLGYIHVIEGQSKNYFKRRPVSVFIMYLTDRVQSLRALGCDVHFIINVFIPVTSFGNSGRITTESDRTPCFPPIHRLR